MSNIRPSGGRLRHVYPDLPPITPRGRGLATDAEIVPTVVVTQARSYDPHHQVDDGIELAWQETEPMIMELTTRHLDETF
jgi:hypothetical protein